MDIQKDDTQNKNIDPSKAADQSTTGTVDPVKKSRPAIHHPPVHTYGRIGKTNPDIKRSIHHIQMSEGHLEHDIARLESDKSGLIEQVRILEKQLEEAKRAGLTKSTTKRLETLIEEARDRSQTLSKIIPEKSFSRDRAMMADLIKKWRDYDHLRTHQAAAEHRFNLNPEDKQAEGEVNRSRATAFTLHQEISDLVKKSEGYDSSNKADGAPEESVLYTHEEANADKEASSNKAPVSQTIPIANETPAEPIKPLVDEKPEEKISIGEDLLKGSSSVDTQSPSMPTTSVEPAVSKSAQPSNPQAFAYAKRQVRKHLDFLFGSKGFLGIGKKSGSTSPDWNDALVGFSKKTASEVLQMVPTQSPAVEKQIGIKSPVALKKIQGYLTFAMDESGVTPEKSEKVEDYLYRAASVVIENFMKTKGIFPPLKDKLPESTKQQAKKKDYLVDVKETKPLTEYKKIDPVKKPEDSNSIFLPISEPDLDPVIRDDLYPTDDKKQSPVFTSAQSEIKKISSAVESSTFTEKEVLHESPTPDPREQFSPDSNDTLVYSHEQMLADAEKRVQMKTAEKPIAPLPVEKEVIDDPLPTVENHEQPQTMPQEIMPHDPQILASADAQVREHLNIFWGRKGFLGLGKMEGANSPHWKDELWGFSGKTVAEILEAKPEPSVLKPGMKNIGINNPEATKKMREYLALAIAETDVHPEPQEKAEDYLTRAAAITINRFTKKAEK